MTGTHVGGILKISPAVILEQFLMKFILASHIKSGWVPNPNAIAYNVSPG